MPNVSETSVEKREGRKWAMADLTSARIEILRFPLIVGVVFIHDYATAVNQLEGPIVAAQDGAWVQFIRFAVSEGVAKIAVPLFFAISGYLFFLGGWNWKKYAGKLHRRLHTLLIPYLFWNLLALAVFAIGQSIPQARFAAFSTRFPAIHNFTVFDYLNAIFGLTSNYPISAQFWFIRDLMALLVLAPAIYLLLQRRVGPVFVGALFCLWFLNLWPLLWPSVDATLFFTLGAFLALRGGVPERVDRWGAWITGAFAVFLVLHATFPESKIYLDRLMMMTGVPAAWWATAWVARGEAWTRRLAALGAASFFVFAAHQPLLTILIRVVYRALHPASGVAKLALFFAVPICLITVLVLLYRLLLKLLPGFTAFITGSAYRTKRLNA